MSLDGRPILVQKFGGSSLADPARLEVCADRVVAAIERGYRVVVVVSAMGRTTDRLLDLAGSLGGEPDPRALDLLLATGELASTAMMAMALAQRNTKATPCAYWRGAWRARGMRQRVRSARSVVRGARYAPSPRQL